MAAGIAICALSGVLGCGQPRMESAAGSTKDTPSDAVPNEETRTPDTTEPGDGGVDATYVLELEGGYGGGRYPAGAEVHLFGALNPTQDLNLGFEVLEGDVELENGAEWHATVVMPANPVRVRYRSEPRAAEASAMPFQSVTGNELTLRYHRVPKTVGIILFLHGTGGSAGIFETIEANAFWLSAVARGYTVVAPEAEESVAGDLNGNMKTRWNLEPNPNNADFHNLNRLVSLAKEQGWADAGTHGSGSRAFVLL